MLGSLTADDFRPHLNQAYCLTDPDGDAVDAVLSEVDERERIPEIERTPFSLIFRTPLGTVSGQGTFRVEREGGDALELFLVPIGPDPDAPGMRYQAVFG